MRGGAWAPPGAAVPPSEYGLRRRGGQLGSSGLITILFTDLVGSTELASELGDAAADDLRREHFASLREAVAATGGTEVKTIGDALDGVVPRRCRRDRGRRDHAARGRASQPQARRDPPRDARRDQRGRRDVRGRRLVRYTGRRVVAPLHRGERRADPRERHRARAGRHAHRPRAAIAGRARLEGPARPVGRVRGDVARRGGR